MDPDVSLEIKSVLSHYDLGELADYEKNERGYVNTAFAIETLAGGERRRLFLRKYKRGVREEELRFEHSLIDHLVRKGVPVADIHRTSAGKSCLHLVIGPGDAQGHFYSIFDYLPGEDRFTWVDPVLSAAQLSASGALLAQVHLAVTGFAPAGRRAEPKIVEMLPIIEQTWAACPAQSKGTVFDAFLLEHFELIRRNLHTTKAALEKLQAQSPPEIVIHCDFHPGNLKFEGERVTGLFDFDWSKIDLRAFDLALALWYFCTSWQGDEDGHLRLDWAKTFLHAYLDILEARPGIAPLIPAEIEYLPSLINASNLYVLNWTILDYFAKQVDAQEYLVYLKHSINFTQWFEQRANRQALESLFK